MYLNSLTASLIAIGSILSPAALAMVEEKAKVASIVSAGGFEFDYHRIPTAKRLAIVVTMPADASLSPKGREALSHVAPALMLMGGGNGQSASELKAEFRDLDSLFDIRVRKKGVTLLLAAPLDGAQEAANLANQIVMKPNFSPKWLLRVKEMMIQRYNQAASHSRLKAARVSRDHVMDSHPYAQTNPFRSAKIIRAVSLDNVVRWHRDVFVRKDIMITASGPGKGQAVGSIIDNLLAGLPSKPINPHPVPPPVNLHWDGKTIVLLDKSAKKPSVMISGEVQRTKSLSNLRSAIAAQILGRGPHSKLFKALRSDLGLAYRVRARLIPMTLEKGIVIMEGEFEASKIAQASATMKKTYGELLASGAQESEFKAARESFSTRMNRSPKRSMQAALMMMSARKGLLEPGAILGAAEAVANTTRSEFNAFIAKHWPQPNKLLTVIVTPDATSIKADCIIRSLEEVSKCRDQS